MLSDYISEISNSNVYRAKQVVKQVQEKLNEKRAHLRENSAPIYKLLHRNASVVLPDLRIFQ